jgi:hypothetical protein
MKNEDGNKCNKKNRRRELQGTTWQQVQETIERAQARILGLIKDMLLLVDAQKGQALSGTCRDFKCSLWLAIDNGGSNPFMMRPLMYVYFEDDGEMPASATQLCRDERMVAKWQRLIRELNWASNLRITIKLIEKPFEGEALYSYSHSGLEKGT